MLAYDTQVQPPAPLVNVVLRHPRTPDRFRSLRAKLDTAADVSAIPQLVADELGLLPARTIVVEGFDGAQTTMRTYFVTLEVAQARFTQLEVILIPDDYALVGRDVLNHFYLRLNGPDLTFEILLTP